MRDLSSTICILNELVENKMFDDVIDLYTNKLVLLEKIPASILSAVTVSLMYKVKHRFIKIIIFQF